MDRIFLKNSKHLDRHATGSYERHSDRYRGAIDRIGDIVVGMGGKRLERRGLIEPNGSL